MTSAWRLVAAREISQRVRSKAFLVSSALLVVFAVAGVVLSALAHDDGRVRVRIALVEQTGAADGIPAVPAMQAALPRLADLLRKARPAVEPQLSPHWRGLDTGSARLRATVPLWIIGAGFALLLALAWFGLRVAMNNRSDVTYAAVAGLRVPDMPALPPAPPAASPRLARFLAPEIKAGLVTVTDEADRSVVRLRGDSVFGSGSAEPVGTALGKWPYARANARANPSTEPYPAANAASVTVVPRASCHAARSSATRRRIATGGSPASRVSRRLKWNGDE